MAGFDTNLTDGPIGRFRCAAYIPLSIIEHVVRRMGVESGSNLTFPDRTLYRHRPAILKRLKVNGAYLGSQS